MRLVLDTNVLLAAFVSRGTCAELFEHCGIRHSIVTSEPLLDELVSVLLRKFKYTERESELVRHLVSSKATIVQPRPLMKRVSRDPDDDVVLATALAGGCECIVTGDKDLLVLKSFEGIPILLPAEFWKFESKE